LVPDCSAESCVAVLNRFISSRGAPKLFVSDNGSAFISKLVQEFVASKFIRWMFNTAAAPWFGGFFERMIKSVKRCLKKVVFNARLNYDELLTVIKEIENIVNNRPLIYMYDDVNQELLTPNKLLFGRNLETVASDIEISVENDISKRAKYTETLLDHWWKRWRDDYLTELREYHKLKAQKQSLCPNDGDIVLIADDKTKRSQWKVGRITKLIRSKDDMVRSAELILKHSRATLRRPINKLYPITQVEKS
jgi:hypothetical protein